MCSSFTTLLNILSNIVDLKVQSLALFSFLQKIILKSPFLGNDLNAIEMKIMPPLTLDFLAGVLQTSAQSAKKRSVETRQSAFYLER